MRTLRASCLCKAIELEIDDDFQYMGYCHCSQCRKFSGAASSSAGGIPKTKIRITKGADKISRYEKSAETHLCFCSVCGSSLFSDKLKRGMVHVRLGILDDVPTRRPGYHIHVSSKADWEIIADDLPQFLTDPPPRRPT